VIDLYDVFSPIALRNRRVRVTGEHVDIIVRTLSQVGASAGQDDILVQVQGASVRVGTRSLDLADAPPEAYASAALFLGCETSERREGPFALYDTFSPTALRGKTALLDGPGDGLTDAIALALARVGARVLSSAPLSEAVLNEAQALGRHVIPAPDLYEAQASILVNLGQRGAHLVHKLGPRTIVNVVPQKGWARFSTKQLGRALDIKGARANAIGITETSNPQDVACLVIFLASDAGRYVTGRCIPLPPPADLNSR